MHRVGRVDRHRTVAADGRRERRIERVPPPALAWHRLGDITPVDLAPTLLRLQAPLVALGRRRPALDELLLLPVDPADHKGPGRSGDPEPRPRRALHRPAPEQGELAA